MNYLLPFLTVCIGFLIVYFIKPVNIKSPKLLLAFSGAFLLALVFFELLPDLYISDNPKSLAVFIMAGLLLQIFLEFFSKGAEHGHVHINAKQGSFPLLLFFSLSIHALLEGVPVNDHGSYIYGILVHKLPISLILSIFLLNSSLKRSSIVIFILSFALMTPIGTLISTQTEILKPIKNEVNALVIGVLLHVSTVILFESSEGHSFNLRKLMVIALGVALAYFL
jgi:zinc transporter ZupT